MSGKLLVYVGVVALITTICQAAESASNQLDRIAVIQPKVETYKTVGDQALKLYVYYPPATPAPERGFPVLLFVHGGGWERESPAIVGMHCRYFASRGLLAIAVQYRLSEPGGRTIPNCVTDVKSAIRWIRQHASELKVNPDKLAAAGESAGGQLAAAAGVIDGLNEPGEDKSVSSRPNLMILFNPVIDMADTNHPIWNMTKLVDRDGHPVPGETVSPFHHVKAGAPPALLMHGTKDDCTWLEASERFVKKSRAAGNSIDFVTLPGKSHAFLLRGYGDDPTIVHALRVTDEFLVKNGYLQGPPTLTEPEEVR